MKRLNRFQSRALALPIHLRGHSHFAAHAGYINMSLSPIKTESLQISMQTKFDFSLYPPNFLKKILYTIVLPAPPPPPQFLSSAKSLVFKRRCVRKRKGEKYIYIYISEKGGWGKQQGGKLNKDLFLPLSPLFRFQFRQRWLEKALPMCSLAALCSRLSTCKRPRKRAWKCLLQGRRRSPNPPAASQRRGFRGGSATPRPGPALRLLPSPAGTRRAHSLARGHSPARPGVKFNSQLPPEPPLEPGRGRSRRAGREVRTRDRPNSVGHPRSSRASRRVTGGAQLHTFRHAQ